MPRPLDLSPYRAKIERAAALTGQEVDRLAAQLASVGITVDQATAGFRRLGKALGQLEPGHCACSAHHRMSIITNFCEDCGLPETALAERGDSYCSGRWTGRRYDAPPPYELIRDWCLDRAWEIRGWPERWREYWREHETPIIWGSIGLALIAFWGSIAWWVL